MKQLSIVNAACLAIAILVVIVPIAVKVGRAAVGSACSPIIVTD
jgi:hypothetical protein